MMMMTMKKKKNNDKDRILTSKMQKVNLQKKLSRKCKNKKKKINQTNKKKVRQEVEYDLEIEEE